MLFGPVTHHHSLQSDLTKLYEWARAWQMHFNAHKCSVLHFSTNKDRSPVHTYSLGGVVLSVTHNTKYLGVTLTDDMKWSEQISNACRKANSKLGMLRRQLRGTTETTRLTLYKTIIRPKIEYASSVWSPYRAGDKTQLEKVQRRSVRWISQFSRYDSVTDAREALDIDTLEDRRKMKDAKLYEDMRCGNIDLDLKQYIKQTGNMTTRSNNITQQHANTTNFHNSYFIRAIRNLSV